MNESVNGDAWLFCSSNQFQLVEQDAEGICNTECKTIEWACQEVTLLDNVK